MLFFHVELSEASRNVLSDFPVLLIKFFLQRLLHTLPLTSGIINKTEQAYEKKKSLNPLYPINPAYLLPSPTPSNSNKTSFVPSC